jgi:hypothetical protein
MSFRWLPTRSFPSETRRKPLLALVAATAICVTGCGSSGHKPTAAKARQVVGSGYRFDAPPSWRVRRSGASTSVDSGGTDLVSVTVFRLARRYEPRLWTKAVPALDRAAEQVATQLHGTIERRATVVVAGRRARQYEIGYSRSGKRLVLRTAFLLDGRRELQLLCRFEAGSDEEACRSFFSSFRPA